jgi:hypothetical protein
MLTAPTTSLMVILSFAIFPFFLIINGGADRLSRPGRKNRYGKKPENKYDRPNRRKKFFHASSLLFLSLFFILLLFLEYGSQSGKDRKEKNSHALFQGFVENIKNLDDAIDAVRRQSLQALYFALFHL